MRFLNCHNSDELLHSNAGYVYVQKTPLVRYTGVLFEMGYWISKYEAFSIVAFHALRVLLQYYIVIVQSLIVHKYMVTHYTRSYYIVMTTCLYH